eukprot:gene20249-22232_t
MAYEENKSLNFLFPSITNQNVYKDEGGIDKVAGNLTGFSSFKLTADASNGNVVNQNERENFKSKSALPHSSEDLQYVERDKDKKRYRESTSESSDEIKMEEMKQLKKKKKKRKKEKAKRKKYLEQQKPNTIWLEEAVLRTDDGYRIDHKCDKDNLRYDTLYRLDIADYNRKADARCLGLRKTQDIHWTDGRNRKKKAKKKSNDMRYFSVKHTASADHGMGASSLLIESKVLPPTGISDFVPLYSKDTQIKPGSFGEVKPSDNSQASEVEFTRKTACYNEQLSRDSSNIQTWLELVKLQDNVFYDENRESMSSTFSVGQTSKKEKAIAEKKLNILEKAVAKNPSSVQLIIEYLKYFRELFDVERVIDKWNEFIFQCPNKGLLWQEYLLFTQSELSRFTMQNTISAYWKSIKTLSGIKEKIIKSHQSDADCSEHLLKIFTQFCFFLIQSDQTEKSIAVMQAMIEFNCFLPNEIKTMSTSAQKEFFETFWDSETARFGEVGALGWSKWMSRSEEDNLEKSIFEFDISYLIRGITEHTEDVIDKDLPKHKIWLDVERQRETRHWKPWQQAENAEEECDDPDRTVLSDDVIPCLFKVDNARELEQLILNFFITLGVPVKADFIDEYLKEKLLSVGIVSYQVKLFTNSTEMQLIFHDKLDGFHSGREIVIDVTESRLYFIRNVLSQLLKLAFDYSQNFVNLLSRTWLIFEIILLKQNHSKMDNLQIKSKKKILKRFSKSLLKLPMNRNCFELWKLYACYEYDYGSREEAFRVFDMVISMCMQETDSGDDLRQFSYLFRDYASFLMLAMQKEKDDRTLLENKLINLLSLLTKEIPTSASVISTEKINPLRLRKTKSAFREIYSMTLEKISTSRSKQETDSWLELILCYVIFELITTDIGTALGIVDSIEKDVRLSRCHLSKIAALRVLICRHNFLTRQTQLSFLHEAVWKSAVSFPDEQLFNSLLIEMESQSFFNSLKLRRFYHQSLKNASSIYPFIFAILFEQKKQIAMKRAYRFHDGYDLMIEKNDDGIIAKSQPTTGIVNRLRSLFQRATDSQFGRHCVALWRSFIKFEANYGNRNRSKNIFYQAIQNCPWAKIIYLDAIELFTGDFEEILDMMQEKEIRIRLPLEEIDILLQE